MPNIHIDRKAGSVTLWAKPEELPTLDDHQRIAAQKRDYLKKLLREFIDRVASASSVDGQINQLTICRDQIKSSMEIQDNDDDTEGQIQFHESQFIPDCYVNAWLLDGSEKNKIALLFSNLLSSNAVVTIKRVKADDESGFIVYY